MTWISARLARHGCLLGLSSRLVWREPSAGIALWSYLHRRPAYARMRMCLQGRFW